MHSNSPRPRTPASLQQFPLVSAPPDPETHDNACSSISRWGRNDQSSMGTGISFEWRQCIHVSLVPRKQSYREPSAQQTWQAAIVQGAIKIGSLNHMSERQYVFPGAVFLLGCLGPGPPGIHFQCWKYHCLDILRAETGVLRYPWYKTTSRLTVPSSPPV